MRIVIRVHSLESMGTYRSSNTAKAGSGVDSADKVTVELVDKAKVIYTPRMKVKTALKGVRMERAERVLDVPYASSVKPNRTTAVDLRPRTTTNTPGCKQSI